MRICPRCGKEFTLSERLCPDDGCVLEEKHPSGDTPAGRVLDGKYRIDGFLTRGGMGAVYRATHVLLDKPVAVKLIKPELVSSPDIVKRFQREARAAAQLSHPNIVTVHDLGQADDGTLYIVMELVHGESLKAIIKNEGPFAPSRAIEITRQICDGLALAHSQNVVHRDLKPQNVVVCQEPSGREVPKLLDFGIAKTFEPDSTALTSTGMVLGTPQYMSPEQAKGLAVDARSDLYSLGIVLYEMLVGKVPFDDNSVPAVLVKHVSEPPQPPSEIRPGLAPELEAVVLRCLEKDPDSRFRDATELASALERAQAETAAFASSTGPIGVGETATLTAPEGAPASKLPLASKTDPLSASPEPPPLPPTRPTMPVPHAQVRQGGARGGLYAAAGVLLGVVVLALLLWAGRSYFGGEGHAVGQTAQGETMDERAEEPPVGVPTAASSSEPSQPPTRSPAGSSPPPGQVDSSASESGGLPIETSEAPPVLPPPEAKSAVPEPGPPPQLPEPNPVPLHPSVHVTCDGIADACAALQGAFQDALGRAEMSIAPLQRADVIVSVHAEEIESRTEEQFGTTFVVRTYSWGAVGEAVGFDESITMPAPEVFSFDARLGGDRLGERARVFASSAVDRVDRYWRDGRSRAR